MAKIIHVKAGELLPAETLQEVAQAAKGCKIIVFPTDTVYGIGSTGLIRAAARRIYEVKRRDSMKPLPILVHSIEEARRWVQWSPAAEILARKFWPGPLTLVLRPTKEGQLLRSPEFPTLAIRVPAHPVMLGLLEASAIPWASSSANLSGSPALNDGAEVAAVFSATVDYLIDAGKVGAVESSVVDAATDKVRVLREGVLSRQEILQVVGAS